MKKNVKINQMISAYGIAGIMLANSTPVGAASLLAQTQQANSAPAAAAAPQAPVQPQATTDVTTVTQTVATETEPTTESSLDPISFKVDPFTPYGENNPTKDDANLPTNKKYLDEGYDKNKDGFIELSEKIEYEIKKNLEKTLNQIGKNIIIREPDSNVNNSEYTEYNIDTTTVNDGTVVNLDADLKTAINNNPNINLGANITYRDVKDITKLDLSGQNLTTDKLSGLKYFTGLEELNLSNNKITNFDELLTLKNLRVLNLSNNKIATPLWHQQLANLPALEVLDLSVNQIEKIGNINLKTAAIKNINLSSNKITEIKNVRIDKLEKIFNSS